MLDFVARPPLLVHSAALVRYLRCLGMRVKTDHPRHNCEVNAHPESNDETLRSVRYYYRGLLELVSDALICGRMPITAEEAERMGEEDPIPWEYVEREGDEPGGLSIEHNFLQIQRIIRQCHFTDEKINTWFGTNNANRGRAKKLFRRGHLDWRTLRVSLLACVHARWAC